MDRAQAVTAERARMARELHDMVANHLSAIAIHSTAALSLDRREGPARDALGVIRANSVQGLAEMRRLIGLLRASGGHTEPAAAPTLDGLGTLVEHARASADGSPIVLRYERDDGAPPLPAPVELAAYRIIQESLTNALKHAAPGEVSVMLDQNPKELIVSVHSPYDNTAGSSAPGSRAPGAGAGLIGMRERAQLLDGTFEAGPDGTVWRVRAVLPT
jgi:signal transduction histidine kinase